MRELTHYELRVLIKNEIDNIHIHSHEAGIDNSDIRYIQECAKDILQYCEEFNSVPDDEF